MPLVLDSLSRSLDALDRALTAVAQAREIPSLPPEIPESLRAGVIQAFEVAYEQSWKMMKRWIETHVGAEAVDGVTRRELFRRAAESKLITDIDLWMTFHKARNETSHTYDITTADEVYASAAPFRDAARDFLIRIESRNS